MKKKVRQVREWLIITSVVWEIKHFEIYCYKTIINILVVTSLSNIYNIYLKLKATVKLLLLISASKLSVKVKAGDTEHQSPGGYGNFCQAIEKDSRWETYKCHYRFLQELQLSYQDIWCLGSSRDLPHEVQVYLQGQQGHNTCAPHKLMIIFTARVCAFFFSESSEKMEDVLVLLQGWKFESG